MEGPFLVLERFFLFFLFVWGVSDFVPGTSRDRGVCPGIFAPALVSGKRDTGTRIFFCPRTKGQLDVPSQFVRPVETLVYTHVLLVIFNLNKKAKYLPLLYFFHLVPCMLSIMYEIWKSISLSVLKERRRLSGYRQNNNYEKCASMGLNGFISKK